MYLKAVLKGINRTLVKYTSVAPVSASPSQAGINYTIARIDS